MSSGAEPGWASREAAAMAAAHARGEPISAEDLLRGRTDVDAESAIRLIYEEVMIRREAGEEVPTAEVVARFPRWADDLAALFDCDRLLGTVDAPVEFPEVGETVGPFRLVGELGRGASGRTYLATDPNLANRPVVLKVIPDDQEEHLALATLRHTHIVPLFSEHSIPERGLRLLCMPYLGGASAARVLTELGRFPPAGLTGASLIEIVHRDAGRAGGARPPSDGPFRRRLEASGYVDAVVWIAACLADALQYAHERGLVHMDVKPSNVLIAEDGQPVLLDFHLARPPAAAGDRISDRLGGTPGYMAPEVEAAMTAVAEGRPIPKGIDGRADIYSLGVLLDEALFRTGPRRAGTAGVGPISTGLRDVVAKCRAPRREDRYPDAAALADDLRRHLNHLPLRGVRNRSLAERWAKWRNRSPGVSARAASLVILAVAAAAGSTVLHERAARIDAGIGQARTLRESRRYHEAEKTLEAIRFRSYSLLDAGRKARRDAELRRVRLARLADDLHALAELCRANYGLELPTGADARALSESCAAIWDRRAPLVDAMNDGSGDPAPADRVRSDLIELAAIRHDLLTRPGGDPTAAAATLREALREFGPSRALSERLAAVEGGDAAPAPEDAPASGFDHYDRGRSLLRAGSVEEAALAFERALHARPDHFWANFYKGRCDYLLERPEAAAAEFGACVAIDPDSPLCRYNRALAYEKLGRTELARLDYTRALELDPKLARAWLNRGILSYREGRWADARSDFAAGVEAAKSASDSDPETFDSLRRHLESADRAPGPRLTPSDDPRAFMPLLSLRDVSLAFGGPRLLDGANLQIEPGERVCLLGRNGEGKSTLLKLLAGELTPDDGEILRRQGLRVSRLAQEVPRGVGESVARVVAGGLPDAGGEDDHRVRTILSLVGLDPEAPFETLSSGMKRRASLARALAAEPDVLLLDEPTNHLDLDSIRWLEEFLPRLEASLVFVTHDRAFLQRLATRIVELDRGKLYDWACDYPTFLVRKEQLLAAEERREALFDKKLAQEEVWIRKGIEARRTRNEGRVRALKAMREQRTTRRERQGAAKIQAQEAERSGMLVVEAKGAGFGYDDRNVVSELTASISRGDKIGIIGPNGAGKTTLLKLLLGRLAPREGTIRHGTNLEIAFFDQLKDTLDEDRTVQQNVTEYETVVVDGAQRHVIGYLQDFLFPPERSRSLVKFLSGGERSRLLLAKLFTKPSNVLVLDEPTNDLDIETLELLESLLVSYQGTILLVSHDRAFLNDVVTSLLAVEPGGRVREFDGGYDDYLRKIEAEAEAAAAEVKAAAEPVRATPKDKPRRLGFKERKELDELPRRIEILEAERAELHDRMADPAFYRRDGSEIARVNDRLAALEAELAAAYARWEELDGLSD